MAAKSVRFTTRTRDFRSSIVMPGEPIPMPSYATVVSANHKENQITVQKRDGQQATYDPKRLQGIAAYGEIKRDFAQGDRVQFTANNRELAVSNRDMGTIERIDSNP